MHIARQQFLLFHISETPVGQLNRFLNAISS